MSFNNITDVFPGKPGSEVKLAGDYCLLSDWKGGMVVDSLNGDVLFDKDHILAIIDHESPAGSIAVAESQKKLIDFADANGVFLSHNAGIGYHYIINNVASGNVVFTTGMHSTMLGAAGIFAVKLSPEEMANVLCGEGAVVKVPEIIAVELKGNLNENVSSKDVMLTLIAEGKDKYAGKLVAFHADTLSLEDKMIICGMAADLGAAYAIFTDVTDLPAEVIDLSSYEAVVALPDSKMVKKPEELEEVKLQGVFLGGCMSGTIEDLRFIADKMKGRKVAEEVRVLIAPATAEAQIMAMDEGLVDIFFDAGAHFMAPGCGSCKATAYGFMDENEVMISAGGFNFKGCGGSQESVVYMSSLRTAVASALAGHITDKF